MLMLYYQLDKKIIKATRHWMSFLFEMKNMSEAWYILGLEIIKKYPKKLLGSC